MLADYHLHTAFSDDSVTPMEDMVQRALALGFDEICFTEHVDYGVKTDLNCDYAAYFRTLRVMQEQYAGRISIRAGIEFGVQAETASQFEDDFRPVIRFDFCDPEQPSGREQRVLELRIPGGPHPGRVPGRLLSGDLRRYAALQNYSVLGHLDMIKRYDKCGAYPDEKVLPLIERILRQAIADGKGIELNTSSFKYGLPDLMPSRRILRFYRELGGELLTIGSDSHETVHLGDHIREVRPVLRDLGFRTFCTFERMKPVFHDL